jgi:hypothetical protein
MARISEQRRKDIERQTKQYQDLLALEMKWQEEEDYDAELPIDLREAAPPPEPEVSKYNPDGIHDIITFAQHPFFCGQKLHPWQLLALKLFYMGTEGNQNLSISKGNKTTSGCEGCIWEYARDSEVNAAKLWESKSVNYKTILPVENAACLFCTRFDCRLRELRFNALKVNARTLNEERKYQRLEDTELSSRYMAEEELLYDSEFNQEVRKQVFNKLGNKFNEMVMVLGRRSGKSLLVTIIALYEVYRLLCMGHPQKRYSLLDFDEITILNVAKNESQSKTGIFSKLKPMVLSSPYLSANLGKALDLELRFLTEYDKKENQRRTNLGLPLSEGTIRCLCGNSSSAGLVGGTNFVVILDEVAAMAGETVDSGVDYALYEDLSPTIATFGDDGKIVSLSNPKGPIGLLFDLYNNRMMDPSTLILQLPTWLTNPSISKEWLDQQKAKDPISFPMQYGAIFGEASQSPFLPTEIVDMMFFQRPVARTELAAPLVHYFAHADPAKNSDYYAFVIGHSVIFPDKRPPHVIIDHIHYWAPVNNKPISSKKVIEYIIELNRIFRFAQVSFDSWNSQGAIEELLSAGVRAIERPFIKSYQDVIYGSLYQLVIENRIFCYNINTEFVDSETREKVSLLEIELTKQQLKMLQKKWRNNGYKVEALAGYHDDIADCIAAVAFESLNGKITKSLPKTRTVYLGF